MPDNGHFVRILDELQRRNVIRVVIAYVVTAWLVIQVVETILPAFGFGTAAIRIVTIAFAVGLVPTIIIAWAFELTPEGLKLDSDVDHSRTMQPGGNKKLDRAIMVILALAVGYFAFDKFVLDPARDQTIAEEARQEGRSEALIESFGANSIAVLAFEDMSPEGDQEYLSDGIAEQVLNLLTRIPDLRVISRSSAFSFKGKSVDLPTIAKQLNVAHVLEGSVRRAGDRIRITAQLIEARSDTHLWSQTYDRTLDDIFAIQDEIATAIVERLQVELLTEIPRQQRVNPEAYMRYMQGRYFTDLGAGGEEAVSLLKQALAIEPEFVDAWLELHRAYAQWPTAEMTREQGARLDDLRDKAFSRAQQIDPNHPQIIAWKAAERMNSSEGYGEAARLFEQAIKLDPYDWDVLRPAIMFSDAIRRADVAISLGELALSRDPLCVPCDYYYSKALLHAGDIDGAAIRQRMFIAQTGGAVGRYSMGIIQLLQGKTADARKSFELGDDDQSREQGLLLARIADGDVHDIDLAIKEHAQKFGELAADSIAELHAMTGDMNLAFHWLRQYAEQESSFVLAIRTRSPMLGNLHGDPRWQEILELAGIAEHQLAAIEFNPQLPQ